MEAFPAGGDGYRILRVAADLNIWQLRRREVGPSICSQAPGPDGF